MSIRKSLTVFCAVVTLLSFGCNWSSPEAKKAKHRERAIGYFEKGHYQEARIEYQNALQIDPKDADLHYQLALTYLKLGGTSNVQQAFTALSRTIELDKTHQAAQLKLGELYLLGNEPAKARKQADLVLVSAPENADGLILRGRSLISEKRYQEGIAELKKAIEVDHNNMQVYIELARAHFANNDPAAVEATLKQALKVDQHSKDILVVLGDFYSTTAKPDQAEIYYRQALEIAPESEDLYIRLSAFYQRYNRWIEAEDALQKLAAIKPREEKPHIFLGDFFVWTGQADKALVSYQRATEINPDSDIARDKLISHYLDIGRTDEAETKVKGILEKNKNDVMGRFFSARLRLAKNHVDEGLVLLEGVVKDEPKYALAHQFLGMALLAKHETVKAREAFKEAVRLNPTLSASQTALARIYLSEGLPDRAIEHAQAAIQLNPRDVQAAVIAGDAYLIKGDLAKSYQVFEAISKAVPNEPIGPYRLGLIARAQKNDTKALAYFEEALKRKPTAVEPITQITMVKIAQGKPSEARERVNKQLEASPDNPLLYNVLGVLWLQVNDAGQAERAFKKAIALDNSLLSAYMGLAQIYYQTGRIEQAEKEYESVLAKDPTAVQAHMVLGITHDMRKDYEKAKAHYEQALKFNPKFAPAANNLAWLQAEHGGNLDIALSYALKAREQQPNDPHIADTLGWIYYKKNATDLATSLLKEAVEKLPGAAEVHFHYGMAKEKSGDKNGARKALQTALQLNPTFPGSDEARKALERL